MLSISSKGFGCHFSLSTLNPNSPSIVSIQTDTTMYKTKLQQLCQNRRWELPEYRTVKQGPDHQPRFSAYAVVNGQAFSATPYVKSAKEARNTAAQIAFQQFDVHSPPLVNTVSGKLHKIPPTPREELKPVAEVPPPTLASPLPSSLPMPTCGLLVVKHDAHTKEPGNGEVLQQSTPVSCHDKAYKDSLHISKILLHQYAQKKSLGFPVYTCEAEGPPSAHRFRSKVFLDGKSYETHELFPSRKEAERAAAKVACLALSVSEVQEDGVIYKNLLQEFTRRKGFGCPSYETRRDGVQHNPTFVSAVEVNTKIFKGAEARTKKQAEMNAAKVAFNALLDGFEATESSTELSDKQFIVGNNVTKKKHLPCTSKRQKDITHEEAQANLERANTSPDNVSVEAQTLGPSRGNFRFGYPDLLSPWVEGPASAEQPAKAVLSSDQTAILPGITSLQKRKRLAWPFSDDQWVSYKTGRS